MELRQYRELIVYRAYADLKAERERTLLGILWWIIEPVTSMLIYYFLFKVVFQRGTEDFVPFLLVGIVIWHWFASTVQNGASAILQNKSLVQQAPIQALVFPVIIFIENSVKFSGSLGILLAFLWIYGFDFQIHYLILPPLLFVELLLIFGAMLPLAAIVPFLPDIRNALPHVLRIGFYGSAILFPPEMFPDRWRWVLDYNPMALVVRSMREILMYNQWPVMWGPLLGAAAFAVFMTGVGALLIHRLNGVYGKRIIV